MLPHENKRLLAYRNLVIQSKVCFFWVKFMHRKNVVFLVWAKSRKTSFSDPPPKNDVLGGSGTPPRNRKIGLFGGPKILCFWGSKRAVEKWHFLSKPLQLVRGVQIGGGGSDIPLYISVTDLHSKNLYPPIFFRLSF